MSFVRSWTSAAPPLVVLVFGEIDDDVAGQGSLASQLGNEALSVQRRDGLRAEEVQHGGRDVGMSARRLDHARRQARHVDEERNVHELLPYLVA